VLYVRDHLKAAGGSTYLLNTLPRFDPMRVRPSLCVLGPLQPDYRPAPLDALDVTFSSRTARDPRRLLDLWRVARRVRPDLLLLSGPRSMVQGRLLARAIGVPSLLRLNFVFDVPPVQAHVQRWLSGPRHRVVAVSEAVRAWAARDFGLPAESIEVVYPAHDWTRYGKTAAGVRSRLRKTLGIAPEASAVLLVGRLLLAEKGQDVMLKALPALLFARPDTVLLLAGDGPDRIAAERLADELGVAARVRFLGHREDVPDLLAACDIVVAPSTCEEAFGLVALEAHAAGRPVVVSDAGGLAEVVTDEANGLHARRGDPAALTAAVRRLLDDPALARRLVERGRADVQRFGLDAHMTRLTELCERLARDPGNRNT